MEADSFKTSSQSGVSMTNPLRNSNFFPRLLPEEEIQKVIFDTDYLDFISKKQFDQAARSDQLFSAKDLN